MKIYEFDKELYIHDCIHTFRNNYICIKNSHSYYVLFWLYFSQKIHYSSVRKLGFELACFCPPTNPALLLELKNDTV